MKRTNFILNGFLALAIVLVFAQCSDKNNNAATSSAAPAAGVAGSSNMKIAYVEIDSLLTKYNFWNDLNEVMIQKEENIRTTLNEKAKKLDADAKEFQRKLENNGFATRGIITLSVCFYIGYRYIKDLNMKQDKNRDLKVGIVVLLMGAVCYLLFITDELRETIFYCSGILLFIVVYLCIIWYRNKK